MRRFTAVFLLVALGACDDQQPVPDEPAVVEVDEAELEELAGSGDLRPLDDVEREAVVGAVQEIEALDPEDPDDVLRLSDLAGELGRRSQGSTDDLTLERGPVANLYCTLGYSLSEGTKNLAATMLLHASDAYEDYPRAASSCVTDAMSATSAALNTFLYASQANSSWQMRHLAVIYASQTVTRAEDAASSCNATYWWTSSGHAYNAWQTANDTVASAKATLTLLNSCVPG